MADRLTPHDAGFVDLTGGVVVGPFAVPTVEQVRAALLEIAERNPEHRAFCRLERTTRGGRWVPLDRTERERRSLDMVGDLDGEVPGGRDAWVDRLVQPFPAGRTFHLSVGHSHVVVWFAHVLGDNSLAWLAPAVLRTAAGGAPPVFAADRTDRLPLTRAFATQFAGRPGRLADAWREGRVRIPPAGAHTLAAPPRLRATGASVSQPAIAAVRRWRDEQAAGASMGSVWTVVARQALESAGIGFASRGHRVLVDARRYLPEGVHVAGNFAIAMYVEPTDPRDPVAVDAIVRRNLDSGRPLGTMAISAARHVLRGPAPVASATGPGRPTFTVSNLGRLRAWEELPGVTSGDTDYFCASSPDPFGVTVFFATVGPRMTVTAAFSPDVLDERAIETALQRFADEPTALLGRTHAGAAARD